MSAALARFHFLYPQWLWSLLLLAPLLWWLLRSAGARSALHRLVDAELLPHLLVARGRAHRWPLALPILAALLVILALAGPTWQRLPQPLYGSQAAQVVALSLSQRMLARDVKPDRLARARFKVHDLLAANAGGLNGLIAYAGEAFVVAPLTTDAHALDNLLNALSPSVMPVPGDDAATAIARGVKLLHEGGITGGSLVLVTDTTGKAAVQAARHARERGVRVSVLGVGTRKGSLVTLPGGGFLEDAQGKIVMARRNDAQLRAVAEAGGGRYVVMTPNHADIDALKAELQPGHGRRVANGTRADRWRDFGPWLLLPVLLLAALGFRRGWVLTLALVLMPLWPIMGHAASHVTSTGTQTTAQHASDSSWSQRWSSLWLNGDQRAARLLKQGHPQRARQAARSPAWRGAAAYRAGDYAAAAKDFAQAKGSDAAYDRGNAQVRQGHYRKALKAYSQALKLDPHNADAAANRKAVEAWLKKQRKQSGQGKSGNKQSGKHGKSGRHGPGASKDKQGQQGKQNGSKPEQNGKASSKQAGKSSPASPSSTAQPPSAAEAGKERKQAEAASKALRKKMDRALGRKQAKPYVLGALPKGDHKGQRLPSMMQQELQRVPDDPGGLLRRKFMLEYERRQNASRSTKP